MTGRDHYQTNSQAIGLDNQLVDNPGLENDPDIAAKLLASFLKCNESKIREALDEGDLAKARKLVNGGLPEFTDAFNIGKPDVVFPEKKVHPSSEIRAKPL